MLKNFLQQRQANTPFLTEEYKCERCKDTGWIETGDEARSVMRCPCVMANEAEQRLIRSGLKDALEQQTFDNFVTKTETQRKLKELGKRYIADLLAEKDSQRRPWLYIGGNPGSGKTHICTAVCGELLKQKIPVLYMQWVDVSRRLKASVNDEDFDEAVAKYINVSVLYVDDLLKTKYTENPTFTDADIKIAFTILNARYLMNKPTIISSEWDLVNQLLPADEGIFSRIYERCKEHRMIIDRNPANNFRLTA